MVNYLRSISEKFKNFDSFGQPIGVFYRGNDVFRTKLGAFCSLIVFSLVLSYIIFDVIVIYTMHHPEISIERKHMTLNQLMDILPIDFERYEFDMGVLVTDRNFKAIEVPPELGRFVLKTDLTSYKDLVPCNSIIPQDVIDRSLPVVKKKFESGKV